MTARKIVFVQGSPRFRGNTRAAAAAAMEAASEAGARVSEIDATKLEAKVNGCRGCYKCQRSDEFRCSIDDQVSRTVAGLGEYDVIVIATPIYWWSYTAQVKVFIDRMFSLSKETAQGIQSVLTGKTLALLATGGGGLENNLELLESQWKKPTEYLGCPFDSCLIPFAPPLEGQLQNNQEAMNLAREFGRRLAGG